MTPNSLLFRDLYNENIFRIPRKVGSLGSRKGFEFRVEGFEFRV